MKGSFWNVLSILFLAATLVVIMVVGVIFFNPDSSLNPFPYPTMPPTISVPTTTPTQFSLPPTWTPTPKPTSTPNP